MERNMTTGSPAKNVLCFALPVFLGNLFQQIYTIVDTIIVGKFVSTRALAAVGSTGTISFLILGFIMGLMAGATVVTSQRFGAGDMPSMRHSVAGAGLIAALSIIIMTAISVLGMRQLLTLMNTPDDIYEEAYTYIIIICWGIGAQTAYDLLADVLRALGNSRVPLYFLIFSASLNIILDLTTIIVFHMGVAGAAWATVISQGVSALLCLIYIIKKVPVLHLSRQDLYVTPDLLKNQLRIGVPMAFQYSITAIGTTMVQASLNSLGSLYVAAYAAATKVDQIVNQPFVALGSAIATFAAQNVGAGRYDRVRRGFRSSTICALILSLVIGILLFFWGHLTTAAFVSENIESVDAMIDTYMKSVSLFMFPLSLIFIYRSGIQGMGYGLLPMMAGVAELTGRAVVSIAAARFHSYRGVCFANPAAWILASVLLLIMYTIIIRKYRAPLNPTAPAADCKAAGCSSYRKW